MVGWRNGLGGAVLLLGIGCAAAGCAAGQDGSASTGTAGQGGSGDGGAGAGLPTTSSGEGGDDATVTVSGSTSSTGSGGEEQVAEVYGHSATTLYRLDPETKAVTIVNPFSGCDDQVIDIALDKDSNLYGTTVNRADPSDPVPSGGLWRIDKNTAACTLVARGDFPNSLSFVPAGTLDAAEEALVGYVGANYVRIDTVGGQITTIRANALTGGLVSSGDIVSVIDGPTLLTVKGGSCDELDCVIEVDPATGAAVGNLGSAGFNNVFGVAFWAGSLYGFTSEGDLFEFVKDESGGITTTPIPVGSGLEFFGAGSTTAAPPTEVPN